MLIGFHGCKGAGKDTAAEILIEHLEYKRLAFADPLKEAITTLFDLPFEHADLLKTHMGWVEVKHPLTSEVHEITWRTLLQRMGTEVGRNLFGEDFWVDLWLRNWYRLRDYYGDDVNVVSTDVRFPNEARAIMGLGGYVIEVKRTGCEPDGHDSEEPLHPKYIETTIRNDHSIIEFQRHILTVVEALERGFVIPQ